MQQMNLTYRSSWKRCSKEGTPAEVETSSSLRFFSDCLRDVSLLRREFRFRLKSHKESSPSKRNYLRNSNKKKEKKRICVVTSALRKRSRHCNFYAFGRRLLPGLKQASRDHFKRRICIRHSATRIGCSGSRVTWAGYRWVAGSYGTVAFDGRHRMLRLERDPIIAWGNWNDPIGSWDSRLRRSKCSGGHVALALALLYTWAQLAFVG